VTSDRGRRIGMLFERALALPPPERGAWLRRVAGDEPGLVEEVEALLAADASSLPVLEATPEELLEAVRPPPPEESRSEHTVGRYRLVREIGRGGMGAVYLAEREDVGLRVALKLLRAGAGLANPDQVRRFLLERRLLARLEHPLIARLLDGGVTPDGTHWLAMELVAGEPITDACDRLRMDVPARLRLFEEVCEAVSYAHRNLVVHRDLKPSNILVVEEPAGRWRPKLLDFGIAKLLDQDDGGLATRTGAWPLTPEYAAPEQLEGGPVTTATDVYGLGVVLYELLTGGRPDPARTRALAGADAGPGRAPLLRPSAAVARRRERGGVDARAAAAARATTPDGLRRVLAGDLDNIVIKALEEDPARRYESAAALGDDMRRYRRGLPVRARAPTAGYRARKFLARNRAAVAVAAGVLASLLLGLGAATWQAAEAGRARLRAEQALSSSQQVRGFLADLFNARHPQDARSTAVTLSELLEQGVRRADGLAAQPLIQAEVLEEIGRVYQNRGEFKRAEAVFRRVLERREAVLGARAPATATALAHLGDAVRRQLRFDEADRLYRRALAIRRATVGERHPEYASVQAGLASLATFRGDLHTALSLYGQVHAIRREAFGIQHPSVAEALRLLAITRRRLGDYPEATSLYREALELRRRIHGPGSPEAAWAMIHLGDQLGSYNGESEAAETVYEEGLGILRARLGDGHPDLLHALHSLATLKEGRGEFVAAEALLRESLEIVRRHFGEDNWRMATEVDILGTHYRRRGDYARAEELHRRALGLFEELYPPAHRYPIGSRSNLVKVYLDSGEYEKAEATAREALALLEEVEGPGSLLGALERERLGRALLLQGRVAEAERQFLEALASLEGPRTDAHRIVRRLLRALIDVYERAGDPASAEPYRARLAVGGG
jgi:eukaryotic-like serine/threonine-protein kinase